MASPPIVFETIKSPAFIGLAPGPDGFIGTADDVLDPNNAAGTVTYGISPMGLVLLYSEATTTILEPFEFENGTSTITDFSTSGSLVPGFTFATMAGALPLPLPHELLTDLEGRTDGEYYLAYCAGVAPCIPPGHYPFSYSLVDGLIHHSSRGSGFFLRRGEDPFLLPGISPTLADYLQQLTGVVPPDWTAITIKATGRLECANWDPEASGFLLSTEAGTRAFYAWLDPSSTEVETTSGDRFVYLNIDAVEIFNEAPNENPINITQLLDGPGGAPGTFVGVQRPTLLIVPDGVCQFDVAGRLGTAKGERGNQEGFWTPNDPARHLSILGGVVATFSTSPIAFAILPTPVEIDIDPDSETNPINPASPELLPIAILGSSSFDVSDIDPTTLLFGPARATPLQHEIVAGSTSTLQRIDFSGTSEPDGSGAPPGVISGTFGVYDVPADASMVPVVASNIELTVSGMSAGNGSFTGWKNVYGQVYLDFTDETPELVATLPPPGEIFVPAFLEDDQLLWHFHPYAVSLIAIPPRPLIDPADLFDRDSLSGGLFQDENTGLLVLTTTPIPAADLLVSHYQTLDTGLAADDTEACVTGQLFDGTPFEGCDSVVVPEPSGRELATACVLALAGVSRRRKTKRP